MKTEKTKISDLETTLEELQEKTDALKASTWLKAYVKRKDEKPKHFWEKGDWN